MERPLSHHAATADPATGGIHIVYRAGAAREALEVWPSLRTPGVTFRVSEEDREEHRDAFTILTPRDAAKVMAFLNGWFAGLPLRERAALAEGLPTAQVVQGDFLARARASERNVVDYPSIGRPAAVDLASLAIAAE